MSEFNFILIEKQKRKDEQIMNLQLQLKDKKPVLAYLDGKQGSHSVFYPLKRSMTVFEAEGL